MKVKLIEDSVNNNENNKKDDNEFDNEEEDKKDNKKKKNKYLTDKDIKINDYYNNDNNIKKEIHLNYKI